MCSIQPTREGHDLQCRVREGSGEPDHERPLVVGASGCVFGLLLAYGMLFPNNVIYIYFALPIKAKYFVILYGAIELFSGIANVRGDNVAHFAHLGGLITGFLLIQFWRNQNRRKFRY